jgi:hypothetical protein
VQRNSLTQPGERQRWLAVTLLCWRVDRRSVVVEAHLIGTYFATDEVGLFPPLMVAL